VKVNCYYKCISGIECFLCLRHQHWCFWNHLSIAL